ncbi:uncharacterized protein si:ch211-116o3.5 [Brienomyrus brachyistius]|uniref:uncharacterized protein si:ch211-116o3.5 n=1 Tax=Brienomyrus brachyistius TaxID=42636 RepID=UPI0020B21397|nr:uncharacterized protein si:ch211-116o3.5 [Brienomyrus brachyistius]XP_048837708.1 uncharacterized protein si:ch211-116o3.5 [Brienomyrus brachyistius]
MDLIERKPNKWWTETDTFTMLALIEELDLVHELDKKRQRNDSHFRRLRHSLARRDIHFSVNQIRNRWKSLKHKYRKIKTAGYRSPAARLSAIESFRYFKKLDRMLAQRPRASGQVEATATSHNLVVLSTSDVEDHTDSDVPQPCATTHWQTEFPGPEGDSEESKGQPDEPVDFKPPHWDIGTEEVVTLGLSGEYLYPVKTEPHLLSSLGVMEGARDSSSCSPKHFSGGFEDTSSLILQQLTILNHQLGEQLAEQKAFHCSMLGLMDRQIEVLQQLSKSAREAPPEELGERDAVINQQVNDALVRILRGVEQAHVQRLATCPSKPSASEPNSSWTVSLLEVHQGSSTTEENSLSETLDGKTTAVGQSDPSGASEQLPPLSRRGV